MHWLVAFWLFWIDFGCVLFGFVSGIAIVYCVLVIFGMLCFVVWFVCFGFAVC